MIKYKLDSYTINVYVNDEYYGNLILMALDNNLIIEDMKKLLLEKYKNVKFKHEKVFIK